LQECINFARNEPEISRVLCRGWCFHMFPGDSGCLEADTMKAAGVMSYLVRKKRTGPSISNFPRYPVLQWGPSPQCREDHHLKSRTAKCCWERT
jgi:hypothetical protein